jgi:hypothetical protein
VSEDQKQRPQYQLAQLNVATFLTNRDAPEVADFMNALDEINALADASDGFVWRLQDESGDATSFNPMGDNTIVNMSVWRDVESLFDFTYRSAHTVVLGRRKEWFKMPKESHFVLWWVPVGHTPDIYEAIDRLHLLQDSGPSPLAFTFKSAYDPTGSLIKKAKAKV